MITFNRRDINFALIAAIGLYLAPDALADDDSETSGGGGDGGADTSDDSGQNDVPGEPTPEPDDWMSNDDPLGLTCRAPMLSGDGMTMLQMLGTGSSVAPDYGGVEPGYYASDSAADTLQSNSDSFFDEAADKLKEISSYLHDQVRDVMEYLSKDWTTSVGTAGEPPMGIVGETPVWAIGQVDAAGHESVTVGVGEHVGVFGTYAITHDPDTEPVSGGVFAGVGGAAVMVSAGISHGDVVVDVGVIYENPVGVSIEVSREFNPTESLREGFQQMFGGLGDYRNFQDPLLFPSY